MSEQPEELSPGDPIVPLAALAAQAAAFSVAGSMASNLYQADSPWFVIVAGGVGGFLIGVILGWFVGNLMFPADRDSVVVVRADRSALPRTLFAAIFPSLLISIAVALALATLSDSLSFATAIVSASIVAVSTGTILGLGSALA